MRYVELYEGVDYEGMFAAIVDLGRSGGGGFTPVLPAPYASTIRRTVQDARNILKKNDRIVWFLRLWRIGLLYRFAKDWRVKPPANVDEANVAKLDNLYQHYLYQYAQAAKMSEQQVLSAANEVLKAGALQKLNHFFGLPIADIQNYIFRFDDPYSLLQRFEQIEKQWQDSRKGLIAAADAEQDGEIVLQFPSGDAWWLMNKAYCDHEAKAMGHCGNAGSNRNDRILSLRKPERRGKEKFYQPYLTFILLPNGRLGEMKGRFNKSPTHAFDEGYSPSDFHDEIFALLKLPLIKGITGGGYLPQENFKIADLPPNQQEELYKTRPELLPIAMRYKQQGVTPDLIEDIQSQVRDEADRVITYSPALKAFEWDWQPNMEDFITQYVHFERRKSRRPVAMWVLKTLEGDEQNEHWEYSVDDHQKEDLLRTLEHKHPDDYATLLNHFQTLWQSEHPNDEDDDNDDDDYDDYDDDEPSLLAMIKQLDDDFSDELTWAVEEGRRIGAESDMYDAFQKWLNNLKQPSGMFITFPQWDEKYYESRVNVMVDLPTVIDWLDEGRVGEDPDELMEIDDIEEPYYGYSGYDESAALERLMDNLPEFAKA